MGPISVLIGNICSFLAMITDAVSATCKTAKGVLWVQSLSQLIYCIGTTVLKGYSGAVQNAVSILRNFVAIKEVNSKILRWVLVALGVVLGIVFNNRGWMGLLPVLANLQYSLAVFQFRNNGNALKISLAISVFLYAIFNIALLNVVGVCTNLFIMVTTLIVLLRKPKNTEE